MITRCHSHVQPAHYGLGSYRGSNLQPRRDLRYISGRELSYGEGLSADFGGDECERGL
jgi:hypothetical protein